MEDTAPIEQKLVLPNSGDDFLESIFKIAMDVAQENPLAQTIQKASEESHKPRSDPAPSLFREKLVNSLESLRVAFTEMGLGLDGLDENQSFSASNACLHQETLATTAQLESETNDVQVNKILPNEPENSLSSHWDWDKLLAALDGIPQRESDVKTLIPEQREMHLGQEKFSIYRGDSWKKHRFFTPNISIRTDEYVACLKNELGEIEEMSRAKPEMGNRTPLGFNGLSRGDATITLFEKLGVIKVIPQNDLGTTSKKSDQLSKARNRDKKVEQGDGDWISFPEVYSSEEESNPEGSESKNSPTTNEVNNYANISPLHPENYSLPSEKLKETLISTMNEFKKKALSGEPISRELTISLNHYQNAIYALHLMSL